MTDEIHFQRTTSDDTDFQALVRLLDAHLSSINGEDDAYYAQFNGIQHLRHVVLAYLGAMPVACGAFKEFSDTTKDIPPRSVEIKRMYTREEARGKGIAKGILNHLEEWAREENFTCAVLETSRLLPSAMRLYAESGFTPIPNYGQYVGMEMSVCFKKML